MSATQGFKVLVFFATLLAFCVVVLGAYVRLSDAGLGCPDWPGCYGHISPHHASEDIAAAEASRPGGPVSAPKAWKEMVHRYFAGTLGLLILAIFVLGWRFRRQLPSTPWLPTILLGTVIFQALLGMWTVTWLLKPVIVTAHLAGGLITLSLLVWLALRQTRLPRLPRTPGLRFWALSGLAVLVIQLLLGGWTSTNYAALACTEIPVCQGSWMPPLDFTNAFHLTRELGKTAQGELLPLEALRAIHWTHRLGAVITLFFLAWVASRLLRHDALRTHGVLILSLLLLQFSLGVSNVWFSLPLPVAVLHNAVAALLLVSVVALNARLFHKTA